MPEPAFTVTQSDLVTFVNESNRALAQLAVAAETIIVAKSKVVDARDAMLKAAKIVAPPPARRRTPAAAAPVPAPPAAAEIA